MMSVFCIFSIYHTNSIVCLLLNLLIFVLAIHFFYCKYYPSLTAVVVTVQRVYTCTYVTSIDLSINVLNT